MRRGSLPRDLMELMRHRDGLTEESVLVV